MAEDTGLPVALVLDCPELENDPLKEEAATEEATEASLSLLDSPGDTLRFLRFLRGRPFNFGAEIWCIN
jgi:hypothetical protein